MVDVWKSLLKNCWILPVLIYLMAGVFKSFNSFNSTFPITKLLCSMVCTMIGSCLVSLSAKKLYLLYDRDSGHYNVITNVKGAMAKKYICNSWHVIRPCTQVRQSLLPVYCYTILYCTCNRCFLSQKCFQNHLILKVEGKLVCQWRQVCRNCSYSATSDSKHLCFKKFCTFCNKKQSSGHLCYVAPRKPSKLSNKY